jgi:hypothetical protein
LTTICWISAGFRLRVYIIVENLSPYECNILGHGCSTERDLTPTGRVSFWSDTKARKRSAEVQVEVPEDETVAAGIRGGTRSTSPPPVAAMGEQPAPARAQRTRAIPARALVRL